MKDNFHLYTLRFSEWMQAQGYSSRTIKTYTQYLAFLHKYLQEETSINTIQDVDTRTLQGYQNYLSFRKTKHDEQLSLLTQGCYISGIKLFFQFLYEAGFLFYNPSAILKIPKHSERLPTGIMSEKEVETLLTLVDTNTSLGFRNRTILEVLYSTAIRNGELCGLCIKDVDIPQARLLIRHTKNRQDRLVPLGEIAREYLHEYLLQIRPKLNARASAYGRQPEQDILFLSKSGKALRREMVEKIVRDLRTLAGLQNTITPHSFRHTCATHMLKKGADIRYIQELLGHRSISSTQVYTHVEPVDLKAVHQKYHPREQFPDTDEPDTGELEEIDHDPE